MKYEDRIVLFLDILGFKSIIDKTIDKEVVNDKAVEKLYKHLSEVGSFLTERFKQNHFQDRNYSVKVTQFSDSIIISFINDDNTTLLNLIRTIQELIIRFVNNGIICRGAISYGKLLHDRKVIFGPALNDAYETESKAAMYPRVILDRSILELNKSRQQSLFEHEEDKEKLILGHLTQDTDDKYYIDYFPIDIGDYKYMTVIPDYLVNLRQIIISGNKFQKPDLKVKYGWMKNKYNTMLRTLKSEDKIKEISKVKNLAGYIEKLKYLN